MKHWIHFPLVMAVSAFAFGVSLSAAEIDRCRELLILGEREECLTLTTEAIEKGVYGESWHVLKADAEFELGKYSASLQTVDKALERYSWSIRLRLAAVRGCRHTGQLERIEPLLAEIAQLVKSTPWRYTDTENLVSLGEFALSQRADAKEVQDAFFNRAKRNNPQHRRPLGALGQLALDKRDFQLAAEIFQSALKLHPDDPDFHFGMAQAFAGSDREVANRHLHRTLELNPKHFGALLYQADRLIDGEQYPEARKAIQRVLEVNARHPEALAYLAVIQQLTSEADTWAQSRTAALSSWGRNPVVDHVIGKKLSQKYRFQQGASFQRQALEFDPDYIPAQKQLAQDLLRLGKEEEGWKYADQVYQNDPYDVAMYNLITLRDELEQFTTIEENGFQIRMESVEAEVYGQRVLALLKEAREVLTAKYRHELPETILVEIFPRPADFEVRTFGMPGIVGYLGVCFGDVITANSPASQDRNPVNLEAVLWHEFAHVVTLNKTNNRMPRWLSEGISVYEERQRDPSWGERMSFTYRSMILNGAVAPIGEISQMFLRPDSPQHVQFAYFQSSLVVEFLIQEYGFETLLKVLDDLAIGIPINESLERHTTSLPQLDEDFAKYVSAQIENFGQDVDWSEPDLDELTESPIAVIEAIAWAQAHPRNYNGLKVCAEFLMEQEQYEPAAEILESAITILPYETGVESSYLKLAEIYRGSGQRTKELEILKRYAALDDDAASVYGRIIELARQEDDWSSVQYGAEKLMRVKPLTPLPHESLAVVAEHNGQADLAIASLQSLLILAPTDPADLHFRLAQQFQKNGDLTISKRHTLQALEEAPRYRAALELLLSLRQELQNLPGGGATARP